jgi:Cu(I)/Ag(I) efflux system membrane fusion protein/cobalt-zinc-cadmium efflux system membrane fusion protein
MKKWKSIVFIGILSGVFLFGLGSCGSEAKHDHKAESMEEVALKYVCPMHPEEVSDKKESCAICGMFLVPATYACPMHPEHVSDEKGRCPDCGMFLVPVDEGKSEEIEENENSEIKHEEHQHSSTGNDAQSDKALYHCPMHPTYIVDQKGDCPICGMSLVPVEDEMGGGDSEVAGYASIRVPPERQQLIGVKTGLVERRVMEKVIRTVGLVDYDEKRIKRVNPRISGWIEDLYVDHTGKLVSKGDPLLTIYSPELVSTQEEYLLALKGQRGSAASSKIGASSGSRTLLDAARKRLELWGITGDQIDELERTGKPKTKMTLHSPIDGFVLEKKAMEGQYINPKDEIYTIADLSEVWIYADIYEYELPFVSVGQEAEVSLSYLPGEKFVGQVDYIYPYLDKKTRTARVRLVLDNPGWMLKPNMYTNVNLITDLGEQMVIPDDAVLDTGTRQVVFLQGEEGRLEPREVKLGLKFEDHYALIDGLDEGDRIITSANFLIDSESRLKAATRAMSGHNH